MSWIKNFNSYRSDYLLKEELTSDQGIEKTKLMDEAKNIRDMLEDGALDKFGTDEDKIKEAIMLITSYDMYIAVDEQLKKAPTSKTWRDSSYNSIEKILRGELGSGDVGVATEIKNHLNKIPGIKMEVMRYPGNTVDVSDIKITITAPTTSTTTASTTTAPTTSATASSAPIKCAKYRDPNVVDENVKLLQQKLKDLGFYEGEPDGKYGDKTLEAVKKFQIKHQLSPAVGCYGPKTALKMQEVSKDYIPFKGDTKKHEKGTGTEEAGKKSQAQSTTKTQNQEQDNSIMPDTYWKNTTDETPSSNEPKQA